MLDSSFSHRSPVGEHFPSQDIGASITECDLFDCFRWTSCTRELVIQGAAGSGDNARRDNKTARETRLPEVLT